MPARSTKARRSDWARFVRHVEQKHGRETAAGAMTAEQLGAVLDRDGLPGIWAGRLAYRVGLRGRTTEEKMREVFHDARVVQEDNNGGDGETVWNLKNKFDSSAGRADRVAEALKGLGGAEVNDGTAEDPTAVGFHGLVFGLPKSVSALALIDDPAVLAALEAATEAYRDAVMTMLDRMARCRSGRRGVLSERGEGVIGATWIHRGSGTGDPHWHVHIALSNSTWREGDEAGRALDGRVLLAAKRMAEAAGLAAMEATLSARLGLGPEAWTRAAAGSVVVPELTAFTDVATALSRARAALVEREVAQPTYAADALRWRQQRAAGFAAARQSRKETTERQAQGDMVQDAGSEGTPEEIEAAIDLAFAAGGEALAQVRDGWRAQAGAAWPAAAEAFARQRQTRPGARKVVDAPDLDEPAMARAMTDLLKQNATPSFFDFAAVATSFGASDSEALVRGAMHFDLLVERHVLKSQVSAMPVALALAKGETIDTAALHAASGVGRPASITTAAWAADRALQRRAEALAGQNGLGFPVEVPEGIDGDQLEAIRLAASGRRLCVITGVAGAGKTVGMRPVAEAAKLAGLTVYSTARNANRARETGEGIEADHSMSLAMLLKTPGLGTDRPVLVVLDEAGVVDRTDLEALLALAADPARQVQIVAMGDRQQAQAIDGVAAFASMEKGVERAGGVTRLATSYRCKAWLKEADEIRAGEGARVLDRVLADGRMVEAKTEVEAAKALAEAVLANAGSVALTSTNEEAGHISRLVQKKLGRDGVIPVRYGKAAVGDRIRVRRNERRSDICNGDEFLVVEISDDCLVVEGKRGRVTLAGDYCKAFVELAYAATIDAAQGVTADRAIVRVDASVGRSKIYAAATRGRKPPIFVTVGENGTQVLASAIRRDDVQMTASEIVEAIEEANVGPTEKDARAAATDERVKSMAELKAKVTTLRHSPFYTPEVHAAIYKLRGFFILRWGKKFEESEAQEAVAARRHAAVKKLQDLERAAHVADFLSLTSIQHGLELDSRIPRGKGSAIQQLRARQDAEAARVEARHLCAAAQSAARDLASMKPGLENIIRGCQAGADGLAWTTRDVLRKAELEAETAAAIVGAALAQARGEIWPETQAKEPAAPRPSVVIQAEIEKVAAEAEATKMRLAHGLEAMEDTMDEADPARIAGEAHAEATQTSFRIRLEKLERELQAALRAERAARRRPDTGASPS